MEFFESAELYKDASPAYLRTASAVEKFLTHALGRSLLLSELGVKVRYIPIIMPVQLRSRYPARSKVRKKERLYDCAPQLNYDVFINGTFEQQLEEYIRGLTESVPFLAKLGASREQVEEYASILAKTKDAVLSNSLDQKRH